MLPASPVSAPSGGRPPGPSPAVRFSVKNSIVVGMLLADFIGMEIVKLITHYSLSTPPRS